MKNKLVKLYDNELSDLRQRGEAFAHAHPKIASRLKLGQGNVEDPMVGRLLESFAFLSARVRYQLEHESQLLSENLTQLLYPHYFLPVPACSTVCFEPADQLDARYDMPVNTVLTTPLANDDKCYFSTRYPVTIRPIKIADLDYRRDGVHAAKLNSTKTLKSCFSLQLSSIKPEQSLQELALDSLRFFINADNKVTKKIYELFFSHLAEIAISYGDAYHTVTLPTSTIKPVGFARNENLLPYPDNSFSGYKLLTEFFAYPEKFNYVDLQGLDQYLTEEMGEAVTISFYFDHYDNELEQYIHDTSLQLHCAPVVNLFEQVAEPIRFDHKKRDYHIIADAQYAQKNIEVYMVKELAVSSGRYKDLIDSAPYFGRQFTQAKDSYLYWHVNRKNCESLGEHQVQGDEVFINISDFNLQGIDEQLVLTPKLLCSNRDAPDYLPFGGGKPELTFRDGAHELVKDVRCVKPISTAKYRAAREHNRIELAEHIFINQVGYADEELALKTIRQTLALYSFAEAYSDDMIAAGVVSVKVEPVTMRHPAKLRQGFCRGNRYRITIDEQYFTDYNTLLFGHVLHEFLSKSCSINSFVELDLQSKQRGSIATWQAKLGIKTTL